MRSAAGSWGTRLTVRGALSKSTHKEERLDHFYDADQVVGDAAGLMNAFAGPAAAETRSKPEGPSRSRARWCSTRRRSLGFGESLESWVSAWRAKAGEVRTGAAVERVLIGEGHVRGVALAGGEEILGSSVVLAIGGAEVRALSKTKIGCGCPATSAFCWKRWRRARAIGGILAAREARRAFLCVRRGAGELDRWDRRRNRGAGGAPARRGAGRRCAREARRAARGLAREAHSQLYGADRGARHAARPVDDPAAPLAGARARPPIALGGFDNLYLVGETSNAPHQGLERIFASARQAAKLIG